MWQTALFVYQYLWNIPEPNASICGIDSLWTLKRVKECELRWQGEKQLQRNRTEHQRNAWINYIWKNIQLQIKMAIPLDHTTSITGLQLRRVVSLDRQILTGAWHIYDPSSKLNNKFMNVFYEHQRCYTYTHFCNLFAWI